MNQNLGPQFDKHVGYAVQELAHNHTEWDGQEQPLHYTETQVHPGQVRFQRYPASDERVQSALEGYRSGAQMPPVVLVHRAGETMTADGHHRLSAAEILRRPVSAVVANSPREDRYSGAARIGTLRKPRGR